MNHSFFEAQKSFSHLNRNGLLKLLLLWTIMDTVVSNNKSTSKIQSRCLVQMSFN